MRYGGCAQTDKLLLGLNLVIEYLRSYIDELEGVSGCFFVYGDHAFLDLEEPV